MRRWCRACGRTPRAIDAVYEAVRSWSALPAIRRAEHLYKVLETFRQMREEFMKVLTEEGGGVYRKTRCEVVFSERLLLNAAEMARHYEGKVLSSDSEATISMVFKRPKGVVGVISPWNYPLSISIKMIAHALAVGSTTTATPTPIFLPLFFSSSHLRYLAIPLLNS